MALPPRKPKKQRRESRWRSPAHLSFVRSHQCIVKGCTRNPIEAAHIRLGSDGSMGAKPSDYYAVSMCGGLDGHHAESHRIGERSFEKRYSLDLLELANLFGEASPKKLEIRRHKNG